MKIILFVILLFGLPGVVFSQNKMQTQTVKSKSKKEIVKILNRFLTDQCKKGTENTSGEIVTIEKPYTITEKNILDVAIKTIHPGEKSYTIVSKKVNLSDIINIVKDVNVLFITRKNTVEYNAVEYNEDGKKIKEETSIDTNFFTDIHTAGNLGFRRSILAAFKNAGFPIVSEYWYD